MLTIIDHFTRWPKAIPMEDISAQSCTRALVHVWISQFGTPSDMTSDRGAQFTSSVWTAIGKILGCNLHPAMAYHP